MEQGIKYVVSVEDATSSGFASAEAKALGLEGTVSKLNNDLRSLASTIGITFAAHEVYAFGKSLVDTQAKLESFRNLINFSSKDSIDAFKNQEEALKVVKDYRMPIMETYDQYSRFLGAVKGTPIEGEKARKTFDDLSKVLAVMHLPAERAGRALYAVQEMFAEGRVQTRHFLRQLAIALPGIDSEAAKVMGVSIESFNKMLRDPQNQISAYDFLPKLFEQLAKDWGSNLPTALKSTQSEVIDLNNQWIAFKDTLATDLKPEIIELLHNLKDGIHWMKEHKDLLKEVGGIIVKAGEFYLIFKSSMLLLNTAMGAYNILAGTATARTTAQTAAIDAQVMSVNALVASIERLNFVTNASGASFLATEAGIVANTAGNRFVASAGGMGAGVGTAVAGVSAASVLPIILTLLGTAAVVEAIHQITHVKGGAKTPYDMYSGAGGNYDNTAYHLKYGADSSVYNIDSKGNKVYDINKWSVDSTNFNRLPQWQKDLNKTMAGSPSFMKNSIAPAAGKETPKSHMPESNSDKVTGQKVISYHVKIDKIMGIGEVHTTTLGENKDLIAQEVTRTILSALNDSQLKNE